MPNRNGLVGGALAALLAALPLGPLAAQSLEPGLGVEAIAVEDDGRILVRNGGSEFLCALATTDSEVMLGDCTFLPEPEGAVAELLASDWQTRIRDAMLDADCKLSTLGAIADVIEHALVADGVSPDEIEAFRSRASERVDDAIDRMLREGALSVRDGELALYACP